MVLRGRDERVKFVWVCPDDGAGQAVIKEGNDERKVYILIGFMCKASYGTMRKEVAAYAIYDK